MPRQQELSDAARIWNRACQREGSDLRDGDRTLGALLLMHGYTMNGGVGHAFELEPRELAEGIAGYRFFGLHEAAAAIKPHHGAQETEFDKRYAASGGSDDSIFDRFRNMLANRTDLFAPVNAP